jgi:hypothetical protein
VRTQQRCSRVSGNTSRIAAQKPSARSPTATTGARIPRIFRSRSSASQLSVDSRWPSSSATTSLEPSRLRFAVLKAKGLRPARELFLQK